MLIRIVWKNEDWVAKKKFQLESLIKLSELPQYQFRAKKKGQQYI